MNINEIAKLAGVSRATVSRYLNNGYVSDEKKTAIQKVIDETGYMPSASAQTLRNKKTRIIGVIIPKINSDSISRTVAGINATLNLSGYEMLLACTNNTEKRELEYLNLFKDNRVDGIILLGTIFTNEHMECLNQLQVPIVILGQNLNGYSCVYYNDYDATKALTTHIIENGNEFGYLSANINDIAVGKNRQDGFISAMSDAGITKSHYHIINCNFTMQSGYDMAKELLSKHKNIDTIICATDTIAIGAMMYLRDMNIQIPNDIQIAGLNDSTMSSVTTPRLTTVHFYYEESGNEAAKMLLELIDNKDSIKKQIHLNYSLVINESTR